MACESRGGARGCMRHHLRWRLLHRHHRSAQARTTGNLIGVWVRLSTSAWHRSYFYYGHQVGRGHTRAFDTRQHSSVQFIHIRFQHGAVMGGKSSTTNNVCTSFNRRSDEANVRASAMVSQKNDDTHVQPFGLLFEGGDYRYRHPQGKWA